MNFPTTKKEFWTTYNGLIASIHVLLEVYWMMAECFDCLSQNKQPWSCIFWNLATYLYIGFILQSCTWMKLEW